MRFADQLKIYIPSVLLHKPEVKDELRRLLNEVTDVAGGCTISHIHGEYRRKDTGEMQCEGIALYAWWMNYEWGYNTPHIWMPVVHYLIYTCGEESVLVQLNHRAFLYAEDQDGVVSC